MDKVVAADGGGVAVTHDDDDLQFGIGQLDAGCEGQGPAVGGVEGVKVHVNGDSPGTADPGDDYNLVLFEPGAIDRPDQGAQKDAVAAARAPDVRELLVMPQILVDQFGDFCHGFASPCPFMSC